MNEHAAPTVTISITLVLPNATPTSVPVPDRDTHPDRPVSVVSEKARERASRYAEEYIESLHLSNVSLESWAPSLKAAYIQGYITREAGI